MEPRGSCTRVILDEAGEQSTSIGMGEDFAVEAEFVVAGQPVRNPVFGVEVRGDMGQPIVRLTTAETHGGMPAAVAGGRIRVEITGLNLLPGSYFVTLGLNDGPHDADIIEDAVRFDVHATRVYSTGKVPSRRSGCVLFTPCRWSHEYGSAVRAGTPPLPPAVMTHGAPG